MPNILITTYCNRRCPYCFALDAMQESRTRQMDWPALVAIADMIVASGDPHAGVLGGEPTLHPEAFEILRYLADRGIRLKVFTNGICRETLLTELVLFLRRGGVRFVVNVNAPQIDREEHRLRQEEFLRRLEPICDLGVNIFRPDLDLSFVADLARRVGLAKAQIRVGLAQPIVGAANQYLALEDYRAVADRIVDLAEAVFDLGLRVNLDCGFPLCAFTDEQLGRLHRHRAVARFYCQTALDLSPDLDAWACFPLAAHIRVKVDPAQPLKSLRERFQAESRALRANHRQGIFEECDGCRFRQQGVCDGGCLAHLVAGQTSHGTA